MRRPTKLPNCPSRSSLRERGDEGMVIVILMMAATLLLVALTVSLPSVYQEGQREKEAELIFRGTQYARAVGHFHRQFNRYPVSIKELMGTNGMRFLRQEYADPMDKKGKWRFIHANAAGVLIDSKNQPMANNPNNPNPAGLGGQATTPNQGLSLGQTPTAGGMTSMGSTSSFGGPGQSMFGPGPGQPGSSGTSSFFGSGGEVQGAFIVGVAATSHHESIRVWQKHHHYDEWEFLGIDQGIFGIQVGLGGASAGPTAPGGQMGAGQQPLGSTPGNVNPGGSPLGSTPPSN